MIEHNGVKVALKKHTPRTQMVLGSIMRALAKDVEERAKSFGITPDDLLIEALRYAGFCAFTEVKSGELDFGPPASPDKTWEAFEAYLDTEHWPLIQQVDAAIEARRTPVDDATGPDTPDDPKK